MQRELEPGDAMPTRLLPAFQHLWDSSDVKAALKRRSLFSFSNFEQYVVPKRLVSCLTQPSFLPKVSEIFHQYYVPNAPDLSLLGQDSIGHFSMFTALTLPYNDTTTYHVLDLRPRGERRKVIHLLSNISAILYIVSTATLDLFLPEDESRLVLTEKLLAFESICSSRFFQDCEVMLLFTDVDEFRRKVASGSSPITELYPELKLLGDGDAETGLAYFTRKFEEKHLGEGRILCTEYTWAGDKMVLEKVHRCLETALEYRREWRREHTESRSTSESESQSLGAIDSPIGYVRIC